MTTDPPGASEAVTGAGAFVELIGVYHADGGPVGEAKYVLGRLLGIAHCALCDVTHSTIRRKPAWDAMVVGLSTPFTLLHLNEMPPDVAAAAAATGTPTVLARTREGGIVTLLGPDALEVLGGSVEAFDRAVRRAAADAGRPLPDRDRNRPAG